jgi:hypothetical protein
LSAEPPPEAIVLYAGDSLAQWESDGRGGVEEITWKQIDEFLRVWPPLDQHAFAAAIRTRRAWPSFQLHLEFRLPLIASATGQTRGNSGIIIEEFEFYEVQILDSYGLPGYWDEAGAIYKKEAPKVNMCAPPGQWQSYDIRYHGPRFGESGELVAKPRITVDLNGKRIHNDVELPFSEAALKNRREKPDLKTPGRITLQHHGDPVDFRNIWIIDLTEKASQRRVPSRTSLEFLAPPGKPGRWQWVQASDPGGTMGPSEGRCRAAGLLPRTQTRTIHEPVCGLVAPVPRPDLAKTGQLPMLRQVP